MCSLIARLAVLVVLGYATWCVLVFAVLLLADTASPATKVSEGRPAAPAATPLAAPTPTPEGRLDRMYKLFHLGS
jgi:hypothetical protein